ERIGDAVRHRRRAIHRRQDADVVAGRYAALVGTLRAYDALEGRGGVDVMRRLGVDAKRVVSAELAHRQVVQMDMLARRDRPLGEADDLVVTLHRLPDCDRARRNLVPGRNEAGHGNLFVDERGSRHQLLPRDDDVVVGVKPNREGCLGQHGILRAPHGGANCLECGWGYWFVNTGVVVAKAKLPECKSPKSAPEAAAPARAGSPSSSFRPTGWRPAPARTTPFPSAGVAARS